MTNTAASKVRKKRNWRDGVGAGGAYRASPHSRQFGTSDSLNDCKGLNPSYASELDEIYTLMAMYEANRRQQRSIVHELPLELIELVLAQLDGPSLLQCAVVCRVMSKLSHNRTVWKNICMNKWPTLRTQILPQLPGAPDYDLIRLYGGCWRQCFLQRHRFNQRAALVVPIPHYPSITVEKVVSETFSIQDHRFCLWIFPHGNPNEPQYAHKVLSVYLVLTDLDRRPPQWLTCAVFSLAVVNHLDPSKTIEWHSCLVDNKFDAQLNNWGVHSLGSLQTLHDPDAGFLTQTETLTITARVRLMSITFRIVFESDMKAYHGLGLVDMTQTHTITLPFCASLNDLLQKIQETFDVLPSTVNIWCFNQPVVSGQALRPRKLLTHAKANKTLSMFGHVLCDGVDIDAYSFCQLYVECRQLDDSVLNGTSIHNHPCCRDCAMEDSEEEEEGESERESESEEEMEMELEPSSTSPSELVDSEYLFIKVMHYESRQLEYLGRFQIEDPSQWSTLTASSIYECVARRLGCLPQALLMFKAEIAPTMYSGPIHMSTTSTSSSLGLQAADIVLFTHVDTYLDGSFEASMKQLLYTHYHHAEKLVEESLKVPTLEQIENLAERLDIPKFRIRSAFRKCHEDGRNTLRYIMEGRHLGFICDSCGETDFKGPRYNCTVCSDYDLCPTCHVKTHEVSHRYANVDGKWQRIYDFKDHKTNHAMREMLPVFYKYDHTSNDPQVHHVKEIDIRRRTDSREEIRMAAIPW